MGKYTYKTNEPKNLNMQLRKNQALTEEGRWYIQEILVGGNACSLENGHDFRKGHGRVFLSYETWNDKSKKREETIVAAQFPENAMRGMNQKIASQMPYPKLIHTLINGGDAVNNLLTRDICVQVYAGTYYSNPGCSSSAASINKLVICAHLRSRWKKKHIKALVEYLNGKSASEGWLGNVSSILQCGKVLEISFCFEPVITAHYRICYSLMQTKLVSAFNRFKEELPFGCKFCTTPEYYKMFVPGTTDTARKHHANILYIEHNLNRASLQESQKNMKIDACQIHKEKKEYEQECIFSPYDKHHAIKVSKLNQTKAEYVADFLKKWFLSGNRKFKYQDTLSVLAVYSSICFEKNGGFVGKISFATVFRECRQLLDEAESKGNILIDLIDDGDIRRILGKVSISCRQYHQIETIAKTLRLSDVEKDALQELLQSNQSEYRNIKIQELRKKTQNKTRDSEARLRKETKIIKRKKCVELYLHKGLSCEEISKIVTGYGFGLRTLKDNIEKWCNLYSPTEENDKIEVSTPAESNSAEGFISDTSKTLPYNVLSIECRNIFIQKSIIVLNPQNNINKWNVLESFIHFEHFMLRKKLCGDVSSSELNNKLENKQHNYLPNENEFFQRTESNSKQWAGISEALNDLPLKDALNMLDWMRIQRDNLHENQDCTMKSKKERFCTRTLPLCDKLRSFLNKVLPHLFEQIYENTLSGKEKTCNEKKVFFAAKSLIFHWVEAAYPAAVQTVDCQMQFEKAAAGVDVCAGGEVSVSDNPGEYITRYEFTQDFVPSAIIKSGVRCVRSLLKKHQFFGTDDIVQLDECEIRSFGSLLYEKTRGYNPSFSSFYEELDNNFESISWDSIYDVVDELAAVSVVPKIEPLTIAPMPTV